MIPFLFLLGQHTRNYTLPENYLLRLELIWGCLINKEYSYYEFNPPSIPNCGNPPMMGSIFGHILFLQYNINANTRYGRDLLLLTV